MAHVLAFDLGTTYLKAVVFDERKQIVALHRAAVAMDQPQPGWAELPVNRFEAMLATAIASLGERVAHVATVTFATQTNTFVLLDADDRVLTPFVVWSDGRATLSDVPSLTALQGYARRTGVPSMSHQFMVAKLRWFERTQPQLWRRAARVALLSDYLIWRLTDRWVTEAGVSGLTGLLDIHALAWWEQAVERAGLASLVLSQPMRAGTDLGEVTSDAAKSLGLPLRCHVVLGCLDQYAGALGAGIAPGLVTETTGTVLATVYCAKSIPLQLPDGVYAGPGPRSDINFLMCFGSTSANLLEHYRRSLAAQGRHYTPDFAELDRQAAEASTDLRIEPFEDGGDIESCFRHVRPHHSPGEVTRAILEAVARQLAAQVHRLCGSQVPGRIVAAGGGARSPLWLDIKSRELGVPVVASPCPEPTSLGAAMLALGEYS